MCNPVHLVPQKNEQALAAIEAQLAAKHANAEPHMTEQMEVEEEKENAQPKQPKRKNVARRKPGSTEPKVADYVCGGCGNVWDGNSQCGCGFAGAPTPREVECKPVLTGVSADYHMSVGEALAPKAAGKSFFSLTCDDLAALPHHTKRAGGLRKLTRSNAVGAWIVLPKIFLYAEDDEPMSERYVHGYLCKIVGVKKADGPKKAPHYTAILKLLDGEKVYTETFYIDDHPNFKEKDKGRFLNNPDVRVIKFDSEAIDPMTFMQPEGNEYVSEHMMYLNSAAAAAINAKSGEEEPKEKKPEKKKKPEGSGGKSGTKRSATAKKQPAKKQKNTGAEPLTTRPSPPPPLPLEPTRAQAMMIDDEDDAEGSSDEEMSAGADEMGADSPDHASSVGTPEA